MKIYGILRIIKVVTMNNLVFQVCAIIVFGCISSEGWRYDKTKRRETCLFNDDANACNFGTGIGVIAFLAAIGFLAGEYLFEQMSSVKTRKHYVLGDLGFSGKLLRRSLINVHIHLHIGSR